MTEMLIKHKVIPSALLASRPRTDCFISRTARARQCFYYFREFPGKHFDKTCSLVIRSNWNSRKAGTGVGMENGNGNLQKSLLFNGFFTGEVHRII